MGPLLAIDISARSYSSICAWVGASGLGLLLKYVLFSQVSLGATARFGSWRYVRPSYAPEFWGPSEMLPVVLISTWSIAPLPEVCEESCVL